MEKIIIVAMTEERLIGSDGDIPWHYPEDLKYFKEQTTGHPVIMGRKTFESLPKDYRPLPNRKNIVLTRRENWGAGKDISVASSLEEAYNIARENDRSKCFIIGGSSVYSQALEDVDKMLITRIKGNYDGDTYFPEWNSNDWKGETVRETEELEFKRYFRK